MELLKRGRAFFSSPSTSRSLTLLALGFVTFVFAVLTVKPGMMGLVSIPISSLQSSSSSFGTRISTIFLPSSSNSHGSPQQENLLGHPDCTPQLKQSSSSSYSHSRDVEASEPLNADIEHHFNGSDTHAQNGLSEPIYVTPPFADDKNDAMDNSTDKVLSPTALKSSESSTADGRKHAHTVFSPTLTNDKLAECDMYRGKWIQDKTYPLYKPNSCPYVDRKFNCQQNGRRDTEYTRWRWVPRDCNWPRSSLCWALDGKAQGRRLLSLKFSGTAMLESLRGKRLVFVGDSLSKNQWESMLCMLWESVVDKRRVVRRRGSNRVLKFLDYNCTVELYTTHYLVGTKKGSDNTSDIIRLDTMDKSETKWRNADVLVFNTVHWWSPDKIGHGENRFQEGNKVYKMLDVKVAYKKALSRWAKWVDTHVDPHATHVFFRTYSPQHFGGGRWNLGGHCEDETEPLHEESQVVIYPQNVMQALQDVIRVMKVHVNVLNVTNLSAYRKDAHPGMFWHSQQLEGKHQDCGHWCLPGLPDTWNELLYFALTNDMLKSA